MKCPKCGYNSFECNDACPRCLNDLTGYKAAYGLKPMALPQAVRTEMARSMEAEAYGDDYPAEDGDTSSDIFSFDFNVNEQGDDLGGDDHFDFGSGPDDSLSRADEPGDAFTGFQEATPRESAAAPPVDPAAGDGEFDLESFSWDDTLESAEGGQPGKPREDDFGSLFGGTKK